MTRQHVCPRGLFGAVMLALSLSALLIVAATLAPAAPNARTSRVLNVNDTGHLHLLHANGEVLNEEGPASGALPGTVKVHMTVGAKVLASFTIQSKSGSIAGHGEAALHSSGRYSSFGGTLTVNHGTGRYTHAHGKGELYGVINRRTDSMTVQTIGNLNY